MKRTSKNSHVERVGIDFLPMKWRNRFCAGILSSLLQQGNDKSVSAYSIRETWAGNDDDSNEDVR